MYAIIVLNILTKTFCSTRKIRIMQQVQLFLKLKLVENSVLKTNFLELLQ